MDVWDQPEGWFDPETGEWTAAEPSLPAFATTRNTTIRTTGDPGPDADWWDDRTMPNDSGPDWHRDADGVLWQVDPISGRRIRAEGKS